MEISHLHLFLLPEILDFGLRASGNSRVLAVKVLIELRHGSSLPVNGLQPATESARLVTTPSSTAITASITVSSTVTAAAAISTTAAAISTTSTPTAEATAGTVIIAVTLVDQNCSILQGMKQEKADNHHVYASRVSETKDETKRSESKSLHNAEMMVVRDKGRLLKKMENDGGVAKQEQTDAETALHCHV